MGKEKKILLMLGLALAVMLMPSSNALDWRQVQVIGSLTPAGIIQVSGTYTNTFSMSTSGVTYQSCHDAQYYQTGACDYLYKCYIILPQSCSQISCAKGYACTEITALQTTETLAVSYAPVQADVGQTYAVSAFLMKSRMTYNFQTSSWSDVTTVIDSTRTYDNIQINGAPVPPGPNPDIGLAAAIENIRAWIAGFFCSTFHIWC